MRLKPFYIYTCIINNLPFTCESITALLHFPSKESFLSILGAFSRSLVGYVGFVYATHICPYSKDSYLCLCYEPLPLISRTLVQLTLCTFVPTLGTLVQTHVTNLFPLLKGPSSMLVSVEKLAHISQQGKIFPSVKVCYSFCQEKQSVNSLASGLLRPTYELPSCHPICCDLSQSPKYTI